MSRLGRHAAVLAAFYRKSSETTCCNDDESSADTFPRAFCRKDDTPALHEPPSILASSSVRSAEPIEDVVCDYAVIGSGKSGSSAVETIRSLEPKARIVVVDPLVTGASMNRGVRHLATRATSIDHSNRTVHTDSTRAHSTRIRYRKSALIATGSRPAPPPESCIRPDSWSRILELTSTAVPSDLTDNAGPNKPMKPILDPASVRAMAVLAASQGAKVAIMGSGSEALEVAATCALNAEASSSIREEDSKVALVFGNAGLLSNRLPRYLSSAVTKRLRRSGIEVHDRSMTRYISMDRSASLMPGRDPARLELYTVKSHDHLDSQRISADLLVYAPCMDTSLNGTAVIPSGRSDPLNPSLDIYLPWSNLVTPPLVTCYLDDGRIATNAEFNAASSIYAAGSVAKFPCSQTGKVEIAGGRHISAEESGRIAALNMIKTNYKSHSHHEDMQSESISSHMPVWRTDRVSYMTNGEKRSEALYGMGIHALSVGRCDSDECATHGFWWTNTKDQRSNGIVDSPNLLMKRATKRLTRRARRQSGTLPAYGSGVIYYLNRTGNITGIMLWGLPFSSDASDISSSINEELVDRMRTIIRSDGAIAIEEHSTKIASENEALNIDLSLLSYLHLAEESKHLASIALSGSNRMDKKSTGAHIVGRRPLHRYSPAKLTQFMSLGKLFRSGDVFYPVETVHDSCSRCREESRPPSLKRIYPMSSGSEDEEFEREMEMRQLQLDRSRPSKEDQLWLRQGDENRYVSAQDSKTNAFIKNMVLGRFADGSDAVSSAPTPEIYIGAMDKISEVNSTLRHMIGIETDECNIDEDGSEET
ncbi:hypothetical protein THAOC_31103 [Thalassiosira oceanica]|uniref:FAD/NAD(P)-binding domain-containing protein n=1 Tax=Thalassiosira oceanica TaxID=159749 RepID=K0R9Y0_THAOC|nr:hypothetical protein THAOC_31103 [Thalassiosira oceanica]|eukprot:EJK49965.1 hypothetical protein THAOC_31103 [Thalassiosira oceanica]